MDTTADDRSAGRSERRFAPRSHRVCALLALALILGAGTGCATGLDSMQSEFDIAELREVAIEDRGRERSVVFVDTAAADEPPVRIAVELRGRGDADRIVVAIHGVLSDRRTWRYVASRLEADHDLMLVDLPGCGSSDKPDPDDLGPDAYTTTSMARRVLIALRHCLAQRDDDAPVTVMAHSLGGAVTLRMLGDSGLRREFADVIARIDGVVLMSALDVRVERLYEQFREIAELTDVEVAIGKALRLLQLNVVVATESGVTNPKSAIREEAQRTIDVLSERASRHAAQAMLRRAIPFLDNERPDWQAIKLLEKDYANVDVPCLIIWGARDESLPCSMAYKLQAQLPDARLRVLSDAMHSLPTERPWTCARLVREFVQSSGAGWRPIVELDGDGPGDHVASRDRLEPTAALP